MFNATTYTSPDGICHNIAPLKWYIGEYYQHPKSGKKSRLVKVSGFMFEFASGWRCTDTVFMDLIRVANGLPVYKDLQLKLEL
jgi:hypothetical protein